MARDINVKILGDNKGLTSALDDSSSKLGSWAGAAAKTVAAGVVAAGAVAVTGIIKAIDFDTQMREVFTLLPGISGEAMNEMSGQVKKFSTDFGVLPNDVVPALYQSLSAGVPPGNVFDFLEVANQAAKGGVTDLTTAVDGISSVVNAYGVEAIDATQASDLMFTAVRLGKTNFEELSASLFQVTPTAAALGVEFGDVTAALASLTAQGVPTSVATTQLRQLFVELSKDGGKAAVMFQDLSGQTFKDFIAGGGNVQDALELMGGAAAESGLGINDLFGSVEAGAAALSLTGANADGFRANLEAMGDSAGATQTAFDTMDGGLRPLINRLKAFGAVALISIGEWFIPKIEQAVAIVQDNWPTIMKVVDAVRGGVTKAINWITSKVIPPLVAAFAMAVAWVQDNWPKIKDTIESVLGGVRSAFEWVINNQPVLIGVLTAIGVGFAAWAISAAAAAASTLIAIAPFIAIGAAIAAVVAGVIYAYQNFETFRTVVDTVRAWLVDTLWPAIQDVATGIADAFGELVEFVQTHWDSIRAVIDAAITAVKVTIETTVAVITAIWAKFGDEILAQITTVFDTIKSVVQAAINIVRGIIQTVTALIKGDWSAAWEGIKSIVTAQLDLVKAVITGALETIKNSLSAAWEAIKAGASAAWETLKTVVTEAAAGVVSAIAAIPDLLLGVVSSMLAAGKSLGKAILDGLIEGVSGAVTVVSNIGNAIGKAAQSAINTLIGLVNSALEFTIPLPFGQSINVNPPDLPKLQVFHTGGIVQGRRGADVPILAQAGEGVFTEDQMQALGMAIRGDAGGMTPGQPIILMIEGHPITAIIERRENAMRYAA